MIFIDPGGSSSIGHTSSSATRRPSAEVDLVSTGPLLRKRRSLGSVQRDLQHAQAQQGALEADRRERDSDLLQQLVLRHRRDLLGAPALDQLHQHRGRRLADSATAALEANVSDRVTVAVERNGNRDLVAAERIQALGLRIRAVEEAVMAGVLVVVENDFSVEIVAHFWLRA